MCNQPWMATDQDKRRSQELRTNRVPARHMCQLVSERRVRGSVGSAHAGLCAQQVTGSGGPEVQFQSPSFIPAKVSSVIECDPGCNRLQGVQGGILVRQRLLHKAPLLRTLKLSFNPQLWHEGLCEMLNAKPGEAADNKLKGPEGGEAVRRLLSNLPLLKKLNVSGNTLLGPLGTFGFSSSLFRHTQHWKKLT